MLIQGFIDRVKEIGVLNIQSVPLHVKTQGWLKPSRINLKIYRFLTRKNVEQKFHTGGGLCDILCKRTKSFYGALVCCVCRS